MENSNVITEQMNEMTVDDQASDQGQGPLRADTEGSDQMILQGPQAENSTPPTNYMKIYAAKPAKAKLRI